VNEQAPISERDRELFERVTVADDSQATNIEMQLVEQTDNDGEPAGDD
jgi:hypothetical protein